MARLIQFLSAAWRNAVWKHDIIEGILKIARIFGLVVVVLLTIPVAAVAKKPLDFDRLRSAGYTSIEGNINHNQRFASKLSGSVLLNESPFAQMLGASKSLDEGRVIRETYDIQDPAVVMSAELAKHLGKKLDLPVSLGALPPIDEDRGIFALIVPMQDEKDLSAQYGPGKLIVNVATAKWAVSKRSKDRYFLFYISNVEIIDSTSAKVIWQNGCIFPLRKKAELPLLATIFENNAKNLKEEIAKAHEYCLAQSIINLSATK